MDVHRCRFVSYPTAAINALAFSHTTDAELGAYPEDLRLAVGRANGDIEIWNPASGAWVQETVFRGGRNRSVEGLQWTQEPSYVDRHGKSRPGRLRLFSIGYTSTVTEWDLVTGLPAQHSTGNHSEAWCLAAQPRFTKQQPKSGVVEVGAEEEEYHQELVAGCADGTLTLLSTEDGELRFKKFLARPATKRARCLSVTYQSKHIVVAGFADSNVRIIDSRTSTIIRNVSLGAAPRGGPREILVWQVRCLTNGDIVTGDSTGEIRFLDGKNYSIYQAIKAHDADVLDLAVSQDATYVWSAGMDRRTVTCFRSSGKGRWAKGQQRAYHEHDVKAFATFEGKKTSMIVSGGLDTDLVVVPMREFREENSRKLSGLPQTPPVSSIQHRRLLVSWWDREVSIWQLARKSHLKEGEKPYKLRARIVLQDEEHITSTCIAKLSKASDLLAIGSAAGVKLFRLEYTAGAINITKVEHNLDVAKVRLLCISPDAQWLATISAENVIRVHEINSSDDGTPELDNSTKVLKRLARKSSAEDTTAGLSRYTRTITRMAFSPDSRMLVTSDLSGSIDAWTLTKGESNIANEQEDESESDSSDSEDEDQSNPTVPQPWTRVPGSKLLPNLKSAPLILTFRPSSHQNRDQAYNLFILTSQHDIYEFDLATGKQTPWSQQNTTTKLPKQFRMLRDRAAGSFWHVTLTGAERLWIWGVNWVCMFDLSRDRGLKRKRGAQEVDESEFGLTKDTRSIAGSKTKREDLVGLLASTPDDDDDEDVAMTDRSNSRKRQKQLKASNSTNGMSDSEDAPLLVNGNTSTADEDASDDDEEAAQPARNRRKFYIDFKYRPILGIAVLSNSDEEEQDEEEAEATTGIASNVIEVAVVERPVFDLDLPPRFEIGFKQF